MQNLTDAGDTLVNDLSNRYNLSRDAITPEEDSNTNFIQAVGEQSPTVEAEAQSNQIPDSSTDESPALPSSNEAIALIEKLAKLRDSCLNEPLLKMR